MPSNELVIDVGGPIQGRLVPIKNLTGDGPDYYTVLEPVRRAVEAIEKEMKS